LTRGQQGNRLDVRVTPGAARSEVSGARDGVLHVKIGAPPERGKANKELSRALGVGRSAVTIVRGHTARNKLIEVAGLSHEEIFRRLNIK
jgi:uncharacterized protein (TIGR00251 family)